MDAVEKAIRNALDRGDAGDAAFRDRVYRSASAALERSVAAHPELTVESVIRRRKHLQAVVAMIESEFAPAAEAAPVAPPVQPAVDRAPERPAPPPVRSPAPSAPPVQPRVSPAPSTAPAPAQPQIHRQPVAPRPEPAAEVDLDALLTEDDLAFDEDVTAPAIAPVAPARRAGPEIEAPRGERRVYAREPRRRSRWPGYLAGLVIVLVLAGAAVWWLLADTDALGVSQLTHEATQTNAPATDGGKGWTTVFTPTDPTRAVASGGAEANVASQGNETVLKISSPDGETPVAFKVGRGVLEQLAGRNAVFDIVARAENGQKTQVSVSCDFGALGDCGRSRFEIGGTTSDHLLRATLKKAVPKGEGTISIVPDVTGGGKALEIIEIRASVENAGSG